MTALVNELKIKRIDPQRPFHSTGKSIKRIVLESPEHTKEQAPPKPLRALDSPQNWMLVVAHSDSGLLDDHAHQTIAGAAIMADEFFENVATGVAVLVMGFLHEDLSNLGADEVIVLPEFDFTHFQPDAELAAIQTAIAQYQPQHIFMPDNAIGDGDLGRRLSAKTQKTIATKVIELSGHHITTYQNGGSQMALTSLPDIILLVPNAVDTQLPFIGKASIKKLHKDQLLHGESSQLPYNDLGLNATEIGETALEEADCVVSAGNGVANITTITTLANLLDASIGASRVAVDDGKFKREQQVGATGKTVTASTYFAIGISGAVQHLQGIKDCRHVIAINKDASAPIVKRADLSIIGDAEDIMQSLILAIKQAKEAHIKSTL